MMKNFTKVILFLLPLLAISFVFVTDLGVVYSTYLTRDVSYFDDLLIENLTSKMGEDFMVNIDEAHKEMDSFDNYMPTNSSGRILYPEDFAGMFINDEGRAVFRIVGAYPVDLNGQSTRSFLSEGALIMPAEFSLNRLESVANIFFDFVFGNSGHPIRSIIAGGGEDILLNRVSVGINRRDDEAMYILETAINDLGLDMRYFHFEYTYGRVGRRDVGYIPNLDG